MLSPALPIKDALRGLRTGLRTGGGLIRRLPDTSPRPVAALLRDVLQRADLLGQEVDQASSRLFHRLLDRPEMRDFGGRSLAVLLEEPEGGELFAARLYFGLGIAFQRLSLPGRELLSEVLAAQAFDRVCRAAPPAGDVYAVAAELLLEADEHSFAPAPPFTPRAGAEDRRLALFAVILWMLVDGGSDDDEETLLGVCLDAACALGRQIADLPRDRAALRALLCDYARLI